MSVMSVKRGTQQFSKAEQSSSAKPQGPNGADAAEFQKAFGQQSVGDVANKLSDPNYVDPSKKIRTAGNNQLDKDAFLKLMLTQMKHQDPTNPMQSHEMAAQLAQFTSLEQLNNINSTLEKMNTAQAPSSNFQALAFIGKKVSGDSSKLTRTAGDTRHAFNFELLGDAAKVNLTVKDAGGNTVRKLELTNLKKGANSIEWNGLMDDGLPARPGEYKITVDAHGSNGAKVYSKTSFEGRITGLNYTAEGPVLMVGGQTIKLSDVKKIEDPGTADLTPPIPLKAGEAAQNMKGGNVPLSQATVAAPLKPKETSPAAMKAEPAAPVAQASLAAPVKPATQASITEPEVIPPAEEPEESEGNIGDVPMSRELMNQLAKAQ